MRKELQPIISLLKQQIFTSETPQVAGNQVTLRYKIPKVGSLFSGSQSCLILNFSTTTQAGMICMTGLLNCLYRANLYIGSHRVVSIQEAGKYLNHKIRCLHTADQIVDKGTYVYGINDKTALQQSFTATTNAQVLSSRYAPVLEPSLQIFTTDNNRASYQLQIPLSLVFDVLIGDMPVYMLGSSDLYLEFALDLTVGRNLLATTLAPTALNLDSNFVYGIYYSLPLESLQRAVEIPFTDVFFTQSLFTAQQQATQSFSLNNQKAKRMFVMSQDALGVSNLSGNYYSFFEDSGNQYLQLQIKYLDEQYWTENILMNSMMYLYTNDCGKYGFLCHVGKFSVGDTAYLQNATVPQTGTNYQNQAGTLNILGVNFGRVPYSHPLIDDPSMCCITMDNHPVQLLFRVQNAANTITKTIFTHVELQKVLRLGLNASLVVD
jgi:hypothetical protein